MRNNLSRGLNLLCKVLTVMALSMQMVFAVGFTASVDNNKVYYGQSIQLKLEIEGAKATQPADFSVLAKDFHIHSQQQYSTYSSVNGSVRSETGWNVTLMPKQQGQITIPSLSIQTDKGLLTSNAISLMVEQPKAGAKADEDSIGISLVSNINKAKAYVNEPVIYTLKIVSYKPIANIVLEDIKSNDAIIEKIGEPKQYDQNHSGVRAHIIEMKYAVSALKAGKVAISPATMSGELQVAAPNAIRSQRFGMLGNMLFDNMFELKPFSMQSDAITIEILPPPQNMATWLPLNNFTLTQSWDNTGDIKVGETITRKIKMVAKGGFAKQLPSVKNDMQIQEVKIYANKPSFTDKFDADSNTIIGTKEEEFSIVPQKDGLITFPEIQIRWWNLNTKKMEISTLPAKTFNVLPIAGNAAPTVTVDYSADEPQQIAAPTEIKDQSKPIVLYIVIGALAGILITLGLLLTFILLKKRTIKTVKVKIKESEKEIVINDAEDLRKFILHYAIKHWHVPTDVTLNRLGDALSNNNYTYDIELYSSLSQYLNAAIYADVTVTLELLLAQWQEFKKSVVKHKQIIAADTTSEDYSTLNPT